MLMIKRRMQGAELDLLLATALFLIILLSGVVQYVNIFGLAAIYLALSMVMLTRIKGRLSRKLAVPLAVVAAYFVYALVLQLFMGDVYYVAFRFFDIFAALLLLNYVLVRRLALAPVIGAVFIAILVHGYVNWLIVNFAFHLFSTVPDIKSYRWLIFFGMDEQYFGIHRSQGLFWEPGVFQVFLNVGLHFFLCYRRSLLFSVLFLVGIGLTLSTTGVLIAAMQIFFLSNSLARAAALRVFISIAVLIAFLFFGLEFVYDILFDKIQGDRAASFWARSFDTLNGIQVALHNPFGIGFNPWHYQAIAAQNLFNIETVLVTDRGQTNGWLILFYSTGILWGFVFGYLLFRQRIFPERPVVFFLFYAFALSTSPLFFKPFTFLLILSSLVRTYDFLYGPKRVVSAGLHLSNDSVTSEAGGRPKQGDVFTRSIT